MKDTVYKIMIMTITAILMLVVTKSFGSEIDVIDSTIKFEISNKSGNRVNIPPNSASIVLVEDTSVNK